MGNAKTEKLVNKYYRSEDHPFNIFEKRIASNLKHEFTVLDAGCGQTAPVLTRFAGKASHLVGVDLVDFDPSLKALGIRLLNNNLSEIELDGASVDLIISRSVLEHIKDVQAVYMEFYRILKPGGKFMFLVPNLWDYVSLFSYLIPNRFHRSIVQTLTHRPCHETFDTYYKSNTRRSIQHLASTSGFEVLQLDYYGQYPYMLEFSPLLFLAGTAYDKFVSRYSFLRYLRGWILCELRKIS